MEDTSGRFAQFVWTCVSILREVFCLGSLGGFFRLFCGLFSENKCVGFNEKVNGGVVLKFFCFNVQWKLFSMNKIEMFRSFGISITLSQMLIYSSVF